MKQKTKVVCAMSGGVDSSVAAAILKSKGYDVIGVFMKLWIPEGVGENRCCNIEAQNLAKKTASILKIPFYSIDVRAEFKNKVVKNYLKGYSAYETPNPCVVCNKYIKFSALLRKTLELGAEYLATGHYVRIENAGISKSEFLISKQITNSKFQNLKFKLLRARDKTKDQSYFLWTLTQNQLKHLLFPIGGYYKTEVREMAKKWGLPVFDRDESQGVCFIGDWTNEEFLAKYIKAKPGPILDLKGNILGEHRGLPFYTIGQRKGLRELRIKNSELRKKWEIPPLYVVELDPQKNALIVGREEDLYKKEAVVKDVNWINGKLQIVNSKLLAQIRYGHGAMPCWASKIKNKKEKVKTTTKNEKLKIVFDKPQRAITPGQSVVFYREQELLGGGVIEN